MSYTLDISAFRFDSKSDYLPYYKRHQIHAPKSATLLQLLGLIKDQDEGFGYSSEKYMGVRVNGLFMYTSTPLRVIVEKFGTTELVIDPLSEFYVLKDLIIDTTEFDDKLRFMQPYMEKGDEVYYREMVSYYYASPTLEFSREYFGDSLMMFAVFLIKKHPEYRDQILQICADEKRGVWLHSSIKNTIINLQNAINIEKNIAELKREIIARFPTINACAKRAAKKARSIKAK
jgi:succinate dehydrogenase/fumarate reductase-like Fe-S protein